MSRTKGVLTIAHSKPKYIRQAVSLARSIKLRAPDIPLAVVTNFPPERFEGLYDQVIQWDFSLRSGIICKLDVYEMSPFDTTLFIEADCLVVKPLHLVFDYFSGHHFAVFGRNEATTPYFQSYEKVFTAVPSATYPIFNGGLSYFEKSTPAEAVYRTARQLFHRYDELNLARVYHSSRLPHGTECDEPLFSLAMATHGFKAFDNPHLDIMAAPERPLFNIDIDILAGNCSFIRGGRLVHPVIPHFVGVRDTCYEYLRETLRLEAVYRHRRLSSWCNRVICCRAYGKMHFLKCQRRFQELFYRYLLKLRCAVTPSGYS